MNQVMDHFFSRLCEPASGWRRCPACAPGVSIRRKTRERGTLSQSIRRSMNPILGYQDRRYTSGPWEDDMRLLRSLFSTFVLLTGFAGAVIVSSTLVSV